MEKVKLIKDPNNGGYLVKKGDNDSRCINAAPLPVQVPSKFEGTAPGFMLVYIPCTTNCMKCNVVGEGESKSLEISCGSVVNFFEIEKEPETKFTVL